MHFSHPPDHRAEQTDAEIDAAVGAFVAELTGTCRPVGAAARRYEHAVETIAEEVTELLATLVDQAPRGGDRLGEGPGSQLAERGSATP